MTRITTVYYLLREIVRAEVGDGLARHAGAAMKA